MNRIEVGDTVEVLWTDGQKCEGKVLHIPQASGDMWHIETERSTMAINPCSQTFDCIIKYKETPPMPAKLVPYVVFMPEGWTINECWNGANCHKCHRHADTTSRTYCPLANAKKAVEINAKTDMLIKGRLTLLDDECSVSMDGKPVTLYAVEDGK